MSSFKLKQQSYKPKFQISGGVGIKELHERMLKKPADNTEFTKSI